MNVRGKRGSSLLAVAAMAVAMVCWASPAHAAGALLDTSGSNGPSQNKIDTPVGGERTDLVGVGPGAPSAWLMSASAAATITTVRLVFGTDIGGGNFTPDSSAVTGTVSVAMYSDSAGTPGASLGSLAFVSADADGFATFGGSVALPEGPFWLQVQVADGGGWVNVAVYGTIVNTGAWSYVPSTAGWYAFGMTLDAAYYGSPRFIVSGTLAGSPVLDVAQLPADVLQQTPLSGSGQCTGISADLDWAGVPGTGWVSSWAQWANAGTGGPVCSRTLFYDGAHQAWAVRM